MVKVAVIGVIAIFLAMSLKSDKQEFAMLVILAASLIILGLALSKIDDVLSVIHMVESYLGDNSVLYKYTSQNGGNYICCRIFF